MRSSSVLARLNQSRELKFFSLFLHTLVPTQPLAEPTGNVGAILQERDMTSDDVLVFGRSLTLPRSWLVIQFAQNAPLRQLAVDFFKSLRLGNRVWRPTEGEKIGFSCQIGRRFSENLLGIVPLFNNSNDQEKPLSNMSFSALTEYYCHEQRAQSMFRRILPPRSGDVNNKSTQHRYSKRSRNGGASALVQYHEQLPVLVAAAISSFAKYTGRYLPAVNDPLVWEAELAYRFDHRKADHRRADLFPVCVAAGIFNEYTSHRILDMSAGWGDRLLAACACNKTYVGVDPCRRMRPVYDAIVKDHGSADRQTVLTLPFEDLFLPSQQDAREVLARFIKTPDIVFDMLFFSPPLFNGEYYCDEPDQCSLRYRTPQEWQSEFLCASLKMADSLLAPHSTIVLHMWDTANFPFAEETLAFCVDVLGWRVKGVYALCAHRPPAGLVRDRKQRLHGKPLWILSR
jgi:hypothetical protein